MYAVMLGLDDVDGPLEADHGVDDDQPEHHRVQRPHDRQEVAGGAEAGLEDPSVEAALHERHDADGDGDARQDRQGAVPITGEDHRRAPSG